MSKQDEAAVANEARKVARKRLERTESVRDIADALYAWNAQMMANDKCVIMPGDCVVHGKGGIESARGTVIAMHPDEIADLIDSGALAKMFDPDDLNAANFSENAHAVFGMISAQRNFADAPHYYCRPELHSAIAVYDVPGPEPDQDTQFSVERAGRRFAFAPGVRSDLGTMRECSYAEFNPANADIMAEVNGMPPEERNRSAAFDRIQELYLAEGSNDVPEQGEARDPRDEPGFSSLPPMEQLARMNAYTEQADAARQQAQAQDGLDGDIPMPGRKRGMPM